MRSFPPTTSLRARSLASYVQLYVHNPSMMKKSTDDLKSKGTWIPHATCVVYGSQGKDAIVIFRLNCSIYQHCLALVVIKVIDGKCQLLHGLRLVLYFYRKHWLMNLLVVASKYILLTKFSHAHFRFRICHPIICWASSCSTLNRPVKNIPVTFKC